jgi:hypothetical protein
MRRVVKDVALSQRDAAPFYRPLLFLPCLFRLSESPNALKLPERLRDHRDAVTKEPEYFLG